MKPRTFYVDETYGPGLVGLLQKKSLYAATCRDADDTNAGDQGRVLAVDPPARVATRKDSHGFWCRERRFHGLCAAGSDSGREADLGAVCSTLGF